MVKEGAMRGHACGVKMGAGLGFGQDFSCNL